MKIRIPLQSLLAGVLIAALAACAPGPAASGDGPNAAAVGAGPAASGQSWGRMLDWPTAAASIMQQGGDAPLLNQSGQRPAPIASAAKIITALTLLAEHPIGPGEPGPSIDLDSSDVKRYEAYRQIDGSVLPVYSGMRLTLREALAVMLLPSANNIADTLAVWAFGSLAKYRAVAQQRVTELKLGSTTVGLDASGFDPSTTSTAHDLALLASAAMDSPVIADLVARTSFDIEGYGPVQNTNSLLGSNGVIGLKTGTSNQARGVFLFAAKATVDGRPTVLVGAVQGAGERAQDAIEQARKLLGSIRDGSAPDQPAMAQTGPAVRR